jgi:hypothetical protein
MDRTSCDPRRGRLRRLGVLTAVVSLGLGAAGMSAASAQGAPVGGTGNHYFISGAGNTSGVAAEHYWFGDPGDEVYLGDFVRGDGSFGGDGRDDAMVRRGNTFTIRGQDARTFVYGDPGDTVLVGDWDGDGSDTLAVRRGNVFFVKNDVTTGIADHVFVYGDRGDAVVVGNWDGDTSSAGAVRPVTTDTLMVRRGNHYFVKNSITSGIADYDFRFGEPTDTVLVGDWASLPARGMPAESGDYADALAVRRGNAYFFSEEVWTAQARGGGSALRTSRSFHFGDPSDAAFTAQLDRTVVVNGVPQTLYGDGLAVRRNDVVGGVDQRAAQPAPSAGPGVRTYVTVGDSITAGSQPYDRLDALGATSWLHGETAERLQLVGGWAVAGASTGEMRAHVGRTPADALVLLGGNERPAPRHPVGDHGRQPAGDLCHRRRPGDAAGGHRPDHLGRHGTRAVQCPTEGAGRRDGVAVRRPLDAARRRGRLGSVGHRRQPASHARGRGRRRTDHRRRNVASGGAAHRSMTSRPWSWAR